MGRLIYDGISDPIVMADRELAHLKVVIGTKLRRQESFMMTWPPLEEREVGRRTVWMHPAIPLQLIFDEAESPPIDRHLIEEMMHALNASGELVLDHLLGAHA